MGDLLGEDLVLDLYHRGEAAFACPRVIIEGKERGPHCAEAPSRDKDAIPGTVTVDDRPEVGRHVVDLMTLFLKEVDTSSQE